MERSSFSLFFPTDHLLCPVALQEYETCTKALRGNYTLLFLSVTKSHKPVTIARWLKTLLGNAVVNTEIFKAHSIRSAITSAAGITTNDIFKAADWSSEAVFQKFYHKPAALWKFGQAVLSSSNSCHPEEATNTRYGD